MSVRRLKLAAAVVATTAVVMVAGAPPASAGVAWGNPNWCTHGTSFGYGAIGMTIVDYRSAYTSGGKHIHRIGVTYRPYLNANTATVSTTATRTC